MKKISVFETGEKTMHLQNISAVKAIWLRCPPSKWEFLM